MGEEKFSSLQRCRGQKLGGSPSCRVLPVLTSLSRWLCRALLPRRNPIHDLLSHGQSGPRGAVDTWAAALKSTILPRQAARARTEHLRGGDEVTGISQGAMLQPNHRKALILRGRR